jgi:hypothetical protein
VIVNHDPLVEKAPDEDGRHCKHEERKPAVAHRVHDIHAREGPQKTPKEHRYPNKGPQEACSVNPLDEPAARKIGANSHRLMALCPQPLDEELREDGDSSRRWREVRYDAYAGFLRHFATA